MVVDSLPFCILRGRMYYHIDTPRIYNCYHYLSPYPSNIDQDPGPFNPKTFSSYLDSQLAFD